MLELVSNMHHVPKTKFAIGAINVTRMQWVLLSNVNKIQKAIESPDSPMVNISLDDCNKYIATLNAMPEFSSQGIVFRLPTTKEWGKARENLSEMQRRIRDWTSSIRGYNYLTMPDGPPGHDQSYSFHDIGLRLCADWTPALEKAIETAKQERASEQTDGNATQKLGDTNTVGETGSSDDEEGGAVGDEAADKKPVILDAVDIVFQVLRDKAHAEQLIRNQLGNDVNDVIIRAEGLDDSHVRGNANDVVQEFTLYFQKHSQEIVKKARGKAGLK